MTRAASWRPKLKFTPPGMSGELELDLFGSRSSTAPKVKPSAKGEDPFPTYVNEIKEALETILKKTALSLWLMVDRLDEVFPRRSELERKALRGLLRTMRNFRSENIRVKVFLRDDMLDHVVRTDEGFTALTHVTVRQADTLKWTQDQLLAMIVKRLFVNAPLAAYLKVSREHIDASATYRGQCFDKVFPPTVFRPSHQSPTIRWICNRCADGRGVVTPRDVLDLLTCAIQKQQDICAGDPDGAADWIIGPHAIQHGFAEMSKRKRQNYLQAEFPHLWKHIEKFVGGKTDYRSSTLRTLLGDGWKEVRDDLLAIGFFSKGNKRGEEIFSIPFLYRHGMQLTQGKA